MPHPPRPNIVLINADDLGYGDLGCYGSTANRTPALDSLATDGLRLTDFYLASPVCTPSRGGMLTGCYPPRIGFGEFDNSWVLFPGMPQGLHPDERTIASLLKQAGYATACVGKWHCGDQPPFLPTSHGFDTYFGLPYSNDMGRQAGRTQYPPLPLLDDDDVLQAQPDQAALTERYTARSLQFIREQQDQPFFLYLAHMYVHRPLIVPEHFMARSTNGRYGAAVECIDWSTSLILHELDRLGLTDNTLVIFTSDNGSRARDEGGSNAPLRGTKGNTFEGGMRLPCLMRWPAGIPAGRTSSALSSAIDLLPTFCELAGVDTPQDRTIDGTSLTPILTDPDAPPPRQHFAYYKRRDLEAVRNDRYKLFFSRDGEPVDELYDLHDDIGETTNLLADHPDVAADLAAHADALRQDLGDARLDITGTATRPVGRVDNPQPLIPHNSDWPTFAAEYDLDHAG
jgi:arylsulfatase A-like enzyme